MYKKGPPWSFLRYEKTTMHLPSNIQQTYERKETTTTKMGMGTLWLRGVHFPSEMKTKRPYSNRPVLRINCTVKVRIVLLRS